MYKVITYNDNFSNLMLLVTFVNIVVMAIHTADMTVEKNRHLDLIEFYLNLVFLLEVIIKLLALGIRQYFYFFNNKFDFFLVIIFMTDWILYNHDIILPQSVKKLPKLLRQIRVIRLTRIFKVITRFKGLYKLIITTQNILP